MQHFAAAQNRHRDVACIAQVGLDGSAFEACLGDTAALKKTQAAIDKAEEVSFELPISNIHRTVGTMLSHEVVKRWGQDGLPDGTIHGRFAGSAGQSFGAWLAQGITLELAGDANDYVGKGLSGGRIVIYPQKGTTFIPQDNVIVGNVVLYGATGGQAFFLSLIHI